MIKKISIFAKVAEKKLSLQILNAWNFVETFVSIYLNKYLLVIKDPS